MFMWSTELCEVDELITFDHIASLETIHYKFIGTSYRLEIYGTSCALVCFLGHLPV